ncbi:hypothetical protein B296_00000900 [Ensete ventricosum]|uniref:Uncharacterized protein n=1 Tax=Ensete ventricosum TaxID=4639 RepID=A0A427B9L2_ENSVE|nr:hypothetical protein B296_00000900 [Ensete ventricosum]
MPYVRSSSPPSSIVGTSVPPLSSLSPPPCCRCRCRCNPLSQPPPHHHPLVHVTAALSLDCFFLRQPPLFLSSLLLSSALAAAATPNIDAPTASSPPLAIVVFYIAPLLPLLINRRLALGSSRPTPATVGTG